MSESGMRHNRDGVLEQSGAIPLFFLEWLSKTPRRKVRRCLGVHGELLLHMNMDVLQLTSSQYQLRLSAFSASGSWATTCHSLTTVSLSALYLHV